MFSSRIVRKFARVALTSAAAGGTLAALLLGAPADAATISAFGSFSRGI